MKIYVASSWRNESQADVVKALSAAGHDVYDFRNPEPGNNGFHWSEIDPNWKNWTPEQFAERIEHPIAQAGYEKDMRALRECDACVLVMPCGRSAHLEAGWAAGAGKRLLILLDNGEPELMYRMAELYTSLGDVVDALAERRCPVCQQEMLPVHTVEKFKVDSGVCYPDNLWAMEGMAGKLTRAWACRKTCDGATVPVEDTPEAQEEWEAADREATRRLFRRPNRGHER